MKELQRGWIGYSEGHSVTFQLDSPESLSGQTLQCFTANINTLPDVRFIAIASSHPIVALAKAGLDNELQLSLDELNRSVAQEREVVLREGKQQQSVFIGSCKNPLTGESLPIFVASYVLEDTGSDAVMGLPAHEERDNRLAEKHGIEWTDKTLEDDRVSDILSRLQQLVQQGVIRRSSHTALRDWLVSRQRHWGTPIPVVNCPECGPQCVPESDLPVLLPDLMLPRFVHTSTKESCYLERRCKCPKCGLQNAVREVESLDTFVDSSWYFLRFLDPGNSEAIFKKDLTGAMPVKVYIGGMEHAIKHLLYARFVHKFLHDLGLIDCSEPFENIVTQGLVKGTSYRLKSTGKYITKQVAQAYGTEEVIIDVEKMSKSKLNGVSPLDAIEAYGVDCLKMAMMFGGPVEKDIAITEKILESMVVEY